MSYQPKTWENKPSTASPINATNLNHMEGGIKTNDDNIIDAQNAILTLQGEMLQAQGDISALETLVESILPVDTESGNPAVITDAFGGTCKSLKLTLEPIQSGSGTPSPQNVRPISGLTEVDVVRTKKNLINPAEVTSNVKYGFNSTTGEYEVLSTGIGVVLRFNFKANVTYCISATMTNGSVKPCIIVRNTDGSTQGQKTNYPDVSQALTFSFTTDGERDIYLQSDGNGTIQTVGSKFLMMLEVGSTATTYEPYNGETYTIQLGQTVYGGVLDVTSGVLTITHGFIDLGSLTYHKHDIAEGTLFRGEVSGIKKITSSFYANDNYCSAYRVVPTSQRTNYTASQNFNNAAIDLINDDYSDPDIFKTAMSGQTLAYELATPITVQLTAEEVTLLHGDNVLTTDADSIEASYSADIALFIDKKIAEGSQNNRSLSKGGSGETESEDTKSIAPDTKDVLIKKDRFIRK